jgi:hypothetical protein
MSKQDNQDNILPKWEDPEVNWKIDLSVWEEDLPEWEVDLSGWDVIEGGDNGESL